MAQNSKISNSLIYLAGTYFLVRVFRDSIMVIVRGVNQIVKQDTWDYSKNLKVIKIVPLRLIRP